MPEAIPTLGSKSDYVLDGSPEAVAIVRQARNLPSQQTPKPKAMSVEQAEAVLFRGGRCLVCGHLQGDHERFDDSIVWTCDDDCDEDLRGYCKPSRVDTYTTLGGQ